MRPILLSFVVALMLAAASASRGQVAPPPIAASIPWKLTVVILDGTDPVRRGEIPVAEAVRFVEARTRFKFEVTYVVDPIRHGFTPYHSGRDRNRDGKGDDVAYAMMGWDVPKELIDRLPVSSSYIFLYRMMRRKPFQAGSALGVEYGLMKGGKPRPYATIPTDPVWYVNQSFQGFRSRAAQIVAHELINTIQGKVEKSPYHCGLLVGTPGIRADRHEAERLRSLTDICYVKLGLNDDLGTSPDVVGK